MKKTSLWIGAGAALVSAIALAGCGSTYYFDGRTLPPSKLLYRVMIAVQNPGALAKGTLEMVDAYYDERSGFNGVPSGYSIEGYGGALPQTIQSMPEEQYAAVYGAGDGSLALPNYSTEKSSSTVSGLPGLSTSVFITRNANYVFAASPSSRVLAVINQGGAGAPGTFLGLPNAYRVSVNPSGTVAMTFAQNSNYAYYPRQLSTPQSQAYSGGPATWPKAAIDCEPQNAPNWCLFQMQSPDAVDSTGNYYGTPLTFDRPVKAVFSADGSTAYILNCGPECGGTAASVSVVPVAPMIFQQNQGSGQLPCNLASVAPCPNAKAVPMVNIPIPGGASNALVSSQLLYVVGQQPQTVQGQSLWAGNLTVVNLNTSTASAPIAISDGQPGAPSRILAADDNTLWIAMTKCNQGVRFASNAVSGYGCLTMFNTSSQKVVMLEPYVGDATGITAITGLHKIYAAVGGQVYIYSTKNGTALDNQYVTVTGTAYDVAYMDAISDADNTVY